jgi:hypothetical protein
MDEEGISGIAAGANKVFVERHQELKTRRISQHLNMPDGLCRFK